MTLLGVNLYLNKIKKKDHTQPSKLNANGALQLDILKFLFQLSVEIGSHAFLHRVHERDYSRKLVC